MRVFPFMPQSEFVEAHHWLTDVIQPRGSEQRFRMRHFPRRTYAHRYQLTDREYSQAQSIASDWHLPVLVPLWEDIRRITSLTPNKAAFDVSFSNFTVGERFLLWGASNNWEIKEITQMTGGEVLFSPLLTNDYVSAWAIPLKEGRFAQPIAAVRTSFDRIIVEAIFETNSRYRPVSSDLYPLFRDHPVVTDRPVLLGDISENVERRVTVFDSATGIVSVTPDRSFASRHSAIHWSEIDRARKFQVRDWLGGRAGRWRGFWVSTWNTDTVLIEHAFASDTKITVDRPYLYKAPGSIAYQSSNGIICKKVVSATIVDPSLPTYELQLDEPCEIDLPPGAPVSRLHFARFDVDRIEMQHGAGGRMDLSVPIVEIPEP